MAQTVVHKRSSVLGKIPTSGQCEYGELIVNYASESGASFFSTRKADDTIATFHEDSYWDDKISKLAVSGGVIDNLTTDDGTLALSAKQGKELNDRLEALENAPNNSVNFKRDTIKLYNQLGKVNSGLTPYCKEMRESMIGLKDFANLGTGLFIHWGVYSVPAGNYSGTKQEGSTITATTTNYNTEWIMRDLGIPRETYKAYEAQFTASQWDPDTLCKTAADCGMGYVVITMKHHDGFALYPSEYGSWDVRSSAARNTLIDELKAACTKYKLKLGFYYSQYWDWMSEGGFGLNYASRRGGYWNGSSTDMYTNAQHTAYCKDAALQIQEMIEKYEPEILWYDPGTNYPQEYKDIFIKAEEENYPHVITNDRLDYNRTRGDFGTGERTIYLRSLPYGEACFTMNDTWGYSDNNNNKYFGIEKVMKQFMIYSLSYGQNCLMNIGPKADGSIPEQQITCLNQIKAFCDTYGHYKNYKRMTTKAQPKWGYMLELEGNKVLCYVVSKGNPSIQDVTIDCVDTANIDSIDILTPGANASYEIVGNRILVHNLALDSTTKIGVVRINYNSAVNKIDANYFYGNSMIPSRVFPLTSSSQSFDHTNLRYQFAPSKNVSHTSEFIWDDDSGNYTMTIDRTQIKESPISDDDITTFTIKDLTDDSVQTVSFGYQETENNTNIALVNGRRYSISFACNGTESATLYGLNGFTFVPEVIIIHPTSVSLDHTEIMIEVGGSGQIEATIQPDDVTNANITWSSDDVTIATVEDGMINGLSAGECNVTVTTVDGGKTASCHVIITAPADTVTHATGLTLSSTNTSIVIGNSTTLTVTVDPADATYQNVEWASDNEDVATVVNGEITAIGVGSATITAKLTYDEITATCVVTVESIHPTGITLDVTNIASITPGFTETINATIMPLNATNQNVIWESSDEDKAIVVDGVVFAKTEGEVTITAKTEDGNLTTTCTVNVIAETYDYLWEVDSLDGSADQGDDTGILLFSDAMPNWTLFGYVHDSKNPNTDNNATLLQCVVNASPWTGYRIDADNNNYPTATSEVSPLIPRFLCATDRYLNPITGEKVSSKPRIDVTAEKHPVCFSRNGNVYKFSVDGVNWITHDGTTDAQLARLVDCPLTVAFDYRRSGGQMTTTKYRFLKTDHPCCVSLKNVSEYPFYTLYNKYDNTL